MDKIRVNLYELLLCLSNAQDLAADGAVNHQQEVACLSYHLAEELRLSNQEKSEIFLASLIHDLGVLSTEERRRISMDEPAGICDHAFRGARLMEKFSPMGKPANIVRYHHLPWDSGTGRQFKGQEVPFGSHIIHLADRTCLKINKSENILSQLPGVLAEIRKEENSRFMPAVVDALEAISKKEYIWLDIMSVSPVNTLPLGDNKKFILEMGDIISLAKVFSHIIDFRSKFTARHSAGVAKTAEKLGELIGFSPMECKMLLVAGYLHDIGKLAIDNDVLEKPTSLNEDEFNEIRSHAYYTYRLLETIPQFNTINVWASYHHERLDGKGYPFHIPGENLALGSRVMAVADVFTAVTENRPYREGMRDDKAATLLINQAEDGALDGRIVKLLIDNFQEINDLRVDSQQMASKEYEKWSEKY
ncbi:HD-GYP domain-containing protein [Parasporobacterium paucivorans]|uniref:HD domain-containing protein n=1 Tax=Parasporobacterium paucivorans DSM 15970 TaxID=1122934 RepID=A0A1M6GFS9_9FIRM|nr:HD domain-containing phosphohydrolase [Parasporobacterium paucivorans]SHJ08779.1 HD domain-containing protein [Parasporobacterium paucivorans DSM 15970]